MRTLDKIIEDFYGFLEYFSRNLPKSDSIEDIRRYGAICSAKMPLNIYFTAKALYIAYKEGVITKKFIRDVYWGAAGFVRHESGPFTHPTNFDAGFYYDPKYDSRLVIEGLVDYHVVYSKHHKMGPDDYAYFGGMDYLLRAKGVLSEKKEPMNAMIQSYCLNFYAIAAHTSFRYSYRDCHTLMRFIDRFSQGRDREYIHTTIISVRRALRRYHHFYY